LGANRVIDRVTGVRYVVPLREGGSLPAVVDADNGRAYVVKFRGAGQGPKALVAELLAGELARAAGLPVPDAAIVELDKGFGKSEPDQEIQDILRWSTGANYGLAYLAGALAFDAAADAGVSPDLAAEIVWFDAFVTNVDRTPRNTNLLWWRERLWLIDHGAALYVHHRWDGWQERVQSPFPQIQEHVLLPLAGDIAAADARLRPRLTGAVIRALVDAVPDEWLAPDARFASVDEQRETYVAYLEARLNGPRRWLQEAIDASERGPAPYAPRATHRVV
jgi:hypothetical protein